MQVQGEKSEQSQEELVQDLQRQVHELTSANLLLQEQLVRKEQFIAMIAHDLRGPLAPIINYAQMLARHTCSLTGETGVADNKRSSIQRQTSIIIGQARRMSRLVNDLLDVSRLSSGQFSLIRESCDITALAAEMIEQLRPLAPYHILELKVFNKPSKGRWDGGRLQQVLGNLLDNAIKYSDERTTVTVTIRGGLDRVAVSVHNEGIGIPSADIGQLFRPYTRLTTNGARQGSGLGLYITKSIIDAHGGTLRLEPHAEGDEETMRGTTFTFELPLEKEAETQLL